VRMRKKSRENDHLSKVSMSSSGSSERRSSHIEAKSRVFQSWMVHQFKLDRVDVLSGSELEQIRHGRDQGVCISQSQFE